MMIQFLRSTFTGGILFLLPVVLLIIVFSKIFLVITKISAPIARNLPDVFLGLDGSKLLTILLIIIICFISGLIFRSRRLRKMTGKLEENLFSYLPGYSLVKSITADALGEKVENKLTTVIVNDGEALRIGFLVEEGGGYCTVFLPEAPRHDSGEVKIVPASHVRKIKMPSNKVAQSLKSYGLGALDWLNDDEASRDIFSLESGR